MMCSSSGNVSSGLYLWLYWKAVVAQLLLLFMMQLHLKQTLNADLVLLSSFGAFVFHFRFAAVDFMTVAYQQFSQKVALYYGKISNCNYFKVWSHCILCNT